MTIKNAILARVDERLKALNMTQRAAEMKAFGKPDVIRNWRRKAVLPRIDTLMQLAPVLETSLEWLLSSSNEIAVHSSGLIPTALPTGQVRITGKVAANTWMDVEDMDFGYEDMAPVPCASGYPAEYQYALLVSGNCLNKIARDGDVLICLNIIAARIDIAPEDLVIVQRSRYGGQMVERTAKRVRQTSSGYELWPESTDPAHQEPIRLNHEMNGNEEVSIIGKVLLIIRKP